jgi:hypothetical protein
VTDSSPCYNYTLHPKPSNRWYASAEGTTPATWPDGTPWYTDPLGPLFVAGIPPVKQQEMEEHCLKVCSTEESRGSSKVSQGGYCTSSAACPWTVDLDNACSRGSRSHGRPLCLGNTCLSNTCFGRQMQQLAIPAVNQPIPQCLRCCWGYYVQGQAWMRLFCAVRTAEIDFQIKTAVQGSGARQMVLLGEPGHRAWQSRDGSVGVVSHQWLTCHQHNREWSIPHCGMRGGGEGCSRFRGECSRFRVGCSRLKGNAADPGGGGGGGGGGVGAAG